MSTRAWISGLVVALALARSGGGAEEPSGATAPGAEPVVVAPSTLEVSREAVPASSGLNAARLLPVGVPCLGVRMPDFEGDVLVTQLTAARLVRIDDQHLDLSDMDLERYHPDGSLDHVVTVERGFYDLETGRLVSRSPTRVRGRAFDIQAQGCDYSRDAPVLKLLGQVTSFIYLDRVPVEENADAAADGSGTVPPPSP
jgi:hypothetical protein